jgi:hypothetical protein
MQFAVLLALPLLVTGATHNHAKLHKRGHALANRAVQVEAEVVTVTELVTVTVILTVASATTNVAAIKSRSTSSTPVVVLTSVSPSSPVTHATRPTSVVAEPSASPTTNVNDDKAFKSLNTVPGSAVILNSCDYHVFVWSSDNLSCDGLGAVCKRLEPNGTHVEPLRKCSDGGVALKISKHKTAAKPMQFEYSVWSDHKTVSYDISYLDCMKNGNNQKDVNECAGAEGGIQAVGGGDCNDYHCPAGQWCAKEAYVVAEFGYQPGAPVGACTVDKGIAFELCASLRV